MLPNHTFQYCVCRPVPGRWTWVADPRAERGGRVVYSDPVRYEIIAHAEGWGLLPVNGSGPRVACSIQETKGQPIRLCTAEEHLQFLRQHFPYTYEYHAEKNEESLASAQL